MTSEHPHPPPVTDECQMRRGSEMEHVEKGNDFGSATNMNSLPDEVLCHIFSHLPTKSAFRNKCVSKRWCSLIPEDSASFCDYYQVQRPFTPLIDLHDENTDTISRMIHVHDSPESTSLDHMFSLPYNLRRASRFFHVLASCKDLVLCGFFRWVSPVYYICICNFFTKQYVTLPSTPTYFNKFGFLFDGKRGGDYILSGLLVDKGYDQNHNSIPSYRVVRVLNNFFSAEGTIEGEIFSSQTGRWVYYSFAITVPFGYMGKQLTNLFLRWHKGVPCNGKLYWWTNYGALLEFDPMKMGENDSGYFSFIDVPLYGRRYTSARCLGSCSGKLRLSQVLRNRIPYDSWHAVKLCIWELEEEKDTQYTGNKYRSLTLKHILSLRDFSTENSCAHGQQLASLNCIYRVEVLYFHPYDPDVICLELNREIVLCNLRKKSLRFVRSLSIGSNVITETSLVLEHPSFPTPVPVL